VWATKQHWISLSGSLVGATGVIGLVTTKLHHHTDPRTAMIQQTLGVTHTVVVVFYKPSVCNPIQRTLVDHHASTALRATGQIRTTLPNTAILAMAVAAVMLVDPMVSCCSRQEEGIVFSWQRQERSSLPSVEDGIHVTTIHGTLPGVSTLRRVAIFYRIGHLVRNLLSPIETDRRLPTGWDLHLQARNGWSDQETRRPTVESG